MSIRSALKDLLYWLPRVALTLVCVIYLVLTLLSNFDALEPYLFPIRGARGVVRNATEDIIIGPYPHVGDLRKLRDERGVSIVVTFLDIRLPQEEALNRRERAAAERLGMIFRNFPMSYFSMGSDENQRQAEALRVFIRENPGRKVYMNCYLGRHRVELARQALLRP